MTLAETEAYLTGVAEPARSTLASLCAAIRASEPRLREEIKWNAPSFALADHLATTGVNRDGTVRLVLHAGATKRTPAPRIEVDDPDGLLERKGPDRVVAVFAAPEDVAAHAAALDRILRAWIAGVEAAEASRAE